MQEENVISSDKRFQFSTFSDVKEVFFYFFRNWIWIALSIFITILSVYLFLRYTIPQYKADITILIKDNNRNNGISDPTMAVFSDLGTFSNLNTNLDNEIEMLRSRSIIQSTIRQLNLNVSYVIEGNIKNQEIYSNRPFDVFFTSFNEGFQNIQTLYQVKGIDEVSFELTDASSKQVNTYTFGEVINVPQGTITLVKTKNYTKYLEKPFEIAVTYYPIDQIVDSYLENIKIERVNKNTNIIEISIVGPLQDKSEAFLNYLVKVYNNDVILDKNIVFDNTSKFIDERIKLISDELDVVERSTESFKKSNHLTDLETEAYLFATGANDFKVKELEAETQIKVINSMLDYVQNNNNFNVLPENIISLSTPTSLLITNYNQLVLDRKRILQDAGPKNDKVLQLEDKLLDLHQSIISSLVQLKTNYELQKQNLKEQNVKYNNNIQRVPTLERQNKNLGRQQNIKEQLYLYLLQKREETAISLAVTTSNAKVIDSAVASKISTTPKSSILYLAALIIGFAIPATILYLIKVLNNKVRNRRDLEKILGMIPILGEIPEYDSENTFEIVSKNSIIAEALRIIRSNLNFLLDTELNDQAQVIFVTSTLPKEGKTFVSSNLAATLALTGKKIALIGMDIRNPKIHEYIKTENIGVTNYLSTKNDDIDPFIHKVKGYNNFYVMPSGPIPPNPAELLLSDKTTVLFEKLRASFDYVIVDNSPMHLVADTQLIANHADAFIYVVRANYLDKDLLYLPFNLFNDNKLKNMSLLLNDVNVKDSYYGSTYYNYGYNYSDSVAADNKKLIKKLKSVIKNKKE